MPPRKGCASSEHPESIPDATGGTRLSGGAARCERRKSSPLPCLGRSSACEGHELSDRFVADLVYAPSVLLP